MNTLDVSIIKVISITRVNTKTRCGFRFKVIISTWGGNQKRILWGTRRDEYEKGDSWSE